MRTSQENKALVTNIPNQDMMRSDSASTIPLLSNEGPPASLPSGGLLKWIGNKQRFARRIVSAFPSTFGTYFEPFVGSGAVLATLAPNQAVASDIYAPLMEIWTALRKHPEMLKTWYRERWQVEFNEGKKEHYERIKRAFNASPNGPDLLFLSRSCYGGVIRFRKGDGYMSTPCGIHNPIQPSSFDRRVDDWHLRVRDTTFVLADYTETMRAAKAGDLVYCDPPYVHTQSILYGAQDFRFEMLIEEIERCKRRGVHVALSIDGHKRSGNDVMALPIPKGLFARERLLDGGASMLKRFQSRGVQLSDEKVADRLLLTFDIF